MKVAEVMRSDLKTVKADDTLTDAVVTIADAHVSGLPVVDTRRELVGVISTTDILNRIAEAGKLGRAGADL